MMKTENKLVHVVCRMSAKEQQHVAMFKNMLKCLKFGKNVCNVSFFFFFTQYNSNERAQISSRISQIYILRCFLLLKRQPQLCNINNVIRDQFGNV